MAGGEFRDDTGGGGADVVHMQFGLGQSGDEGVQVARDAGVDETVGQGSSPGTASLAGRAVGGTR